MSMLPPTPGETTTPTNPLPAANPDMTQLPPSQDAPGSKSSLSSIAWLIVAITGLLLVLTCSGLALLAAGFLPRSPTVSSLPPSPTPPVVTILGLEKITELATIKTPVVAAVEVANVPDDWRERLGVSERIVMIVYGTAKTGFDLNKVKEDDLWTDGKRVQLYLPSPELLSLELDFEKSRIVDYDRTMLMPQDPDIQAKALALAQAELKQSAQDANVKRLAKDFARAYFADHLRSLGFEEVRIEFR